MFATAVRFLAKKAKAKKSKPANMNIGLEGQQWSTTLRDIVKEKGPLTVAGFWQEAQSTGLRSKRHMKIVLKWMRGQNHVKLLCNHLGDKHTATEKEFLYAYVTPRSERLAAQMALSSASEDGSPTPDCDASSVDFNDLPTSDASYVDSQDPPTGDPHSPRFEDPIRQI